MASSIKFSDLHVCKEFTHKDKVKIFRYIEAVYSKESHLNSVQNLLEKKIEACRVAKLDSILPWVIEMMDMKNPDVNNLIFAFHALYQNSNEMAQLCQDQQLLWNINQLLLKNPEATEESELMDIYKKRASLSETSDIVGKRINRLLSEIFVEKETQVMAVSYIRQMVRPEERIRLRDQQKAAS